MAKDKTIPAASLSFLDVAPEFDLPVTLDIRGKQHKITFRCKSHTKIEWAEVRDAGVDDAIERQKARKEKASEERARLVDVVRENIASDADLVLQFAIGWDLSDPLNRETLTKMDNICGGALAATVAAYEAAIFQGRLGN